MIFEAEHPVEKTPACPVRMYKVGDTETVLPGMSATVNVSKVSLDEATFGAGDLGVGVRQVRIY